MNIHHKVLTDVPWKELNHQLISLEKYRPDYSDSAAKIIADIRRYVVAGLYSYKYSAQIVYDMSFCGAEHVGTYVQSFDVINPGKPAWQKGDLLVIFNEGVDRMHTAQNQIVLSTTRYVQSKQINKIIIVKTKRLAVSRTHPN